MDAGPSPLVSGDAIGPAERTADLYARHGQRVFGFCRSRLRNTEEAQDAAQTAFLYALAALRHGVILRNELAWLLTIADNVCRSSRRTLGRRLAHVANAAVDELEAAAWALSAETREEIAELQAALAQLPERQRQAILLREWQGLSYADIAEQLGLSLAAVETLLFRSRRSLMRRLRSPRTRLGVVELASGGSPRSVLG
jgi:RNA polymerase sigma factor (sigma-70 family)